MTSQSPSNEAPGTSHNSPIAISCPVVFSWISLMVWNLFPFKGDFSFEKVQKSQGLNLACKVGWVTWEIWCFAKKLCLRRDARAGTLLWRKVPITSCSQLQPSESSNSFCRGMFKLNAKSDADLLLYSLSHFECNGCTAHMLTQRCLSPPLSSTVKSSLSHTCIQVHSPWLPNYSNVVETILVNNGWAFSRQASYIYLFYCLKTPLISLNILRGMFTVLGSLRSASFALILNLCEHQNQ